MEIHPLALASSMTEEALREGFDRGRASAHAGNGPTRVFILAGDNDDAQIEISCVIRNDDALVYHAAPMRPQYQELLDVIDAKASESDKENPQYGFSADDVALTEDLIQRLFEAAEKGHNVDWLAVRTRPGRPAPLAMGNMVQLGLPADLYQAISSQAASERVSMAAVITDILLGGLTPAPISAI